MRLHRLQPEITHTEGNSIVPAKAVGYTRDVDGNIVEVIKHHTHQFENQLKGKMKSELEHLPSFPTKEEVFVSISHGLHAAHEYRDFDLDNRAKTILDALKDAVYEDDKQVKVLLTDKMFLKDQQESYYKISVKILDRKAESMLDKHLSQIGV